ncbi:outer membrane beta-barrel protein [Microbulbifer sp. SSSA008]|uniref:outer membrane beta-barrel protein n=1 Tax=unclassified Microbulbifer TaxID=2619833 RepID=UPI00403905A8
MKKTTFFLFALFATSNTIAQEDNYYLRISYGSVDTDIEAQEVIDSYDYSLSDSEGWSFSAGYRINRFLALEGGFSDLGKSSGMYHYSSTDTNFSITENLSSEIKLKTLGLSISTDTKKALYTGLRFGYQRWDVKYKFKGEYLEYLAAPTVIGAPGSGGPVEYSESSKWRNDGYDWYYGIAAGWNYQNWAIILEHTIYNVDNETPSFSALALSYNF